MEEPVIFEVKNNIAFIRLNRPDKMNAVNREMAKCLLRKLHVCYEDKNIRCVYLTGSGKGFCAGQDLSEATGIHDEEVTAILREQFNPIVAHIRQLEKPVVGAINGTAAGAGANIALACDIVLATESASFVQAFSKIGLVPDSGGTFILPRFVGWQRASALMMLAEKISAIEAERIGMVYKVFADDIFEKETIAIAEKLAAMPTRSLGLIKKALNFSVSSTFEQQLILEDKFQKEATATSDYKEGVDAFMQKRKPNFTGE